MTTDVSKDHQGYTWTGVILGVVSFCIALYGVRYLGGVLSTPGTIHLSEPTTVTVGAGPRAVDVETDTITTWFGTLSIVFAIASGIWIASAVSCRRVIGIGGDIGDKKLNTWIVGVSLLMCLEFVFSAVSPSHLRPGFHAAFWNITHIACAAFIIWACYRWYQANITMPEFLREHEQKS